MNSREHGIDHSPKTPEFPKSLSETDIRLVRKQCELQHATSKEQIEGFAAAYRDAKEIAANFAVSEPMTGERVEELILHLAALIEKRNEKGFRRTPVTFAAGGSALRPDLIERAIQNFSGAFAEGLLEPVEAYTEFEKIHPFEDGNGRVGDLLWKMETARRTGTWPEEMPPDVFGVHKEETK